MPKRSAKVAAVGITPEQFRQLTDRVTKGPKHHATPASQNDPQPESLVGRLVLGVDPSLRGTGFGIILVQRPTSQAVVHGRISCPASWPRSRCLAKISVTLRDLIHTHKPYICAIEGLFFAQNLQTALIMGEARGAALSPIAEAGLNIFEVAPRKMKQAIVGYGAAQKSAVAKMVQRMLQLSEEPDPDAADALALALTLVQEQNPFSLSKPRKV